MARTNGFTAEQFIKAIAGTGGIHSMIAAKVGCERHTVKKYIEAYATVKQAYLDEKHKVDDVALSNIYKAIVTDKDLGTSMWWVKMKLGDEFHETHQVLMVDWDDDSRDND